MVEPTTTRLTFTVDAETYRRVEAAQIAEREAFHRSVTAEHDSTFERAQCVALRRELAHARRELLDAYAVLARELDPGEALMFPLAQAMSKLLYNAAWDERHATAMQRSGVAS